MLKYKNYQLIKLTLSQEKQVYDLINKKDGSVFHEPILNKTISAYFHSELFYLVDNPESIKHASVVHLNKDHMGFKRYNLSSIADIPYSGFIGNQNVDFNKLKVSPIETLHYVGFPYQTHKQPTYDYGETAIVDLTLDEDYIFTNVIHSKRRNMIRKAINSNFVVKSFNSLEGFDIFWPILKKLHEKLGFKQLTYKYYHDLLTPYFEKKQAFVLLALKNDVPISGIVLLGNKNYMHYYKGASLDNAPNEGQGELLQWEAIKLSKKLGVKYYDLCNINKEKLPQIYKFKTGISNNIYSYPIFTYKPFLYKVLNRIQKSL